MSNFLDFLYKKRIDGSVIFYFYVMCKKVLLDQLHRHFLDAVKKGEFELVQYFIEKIPELNINYIGNNGKSALIWAIFKGHTEIALYLLNRPKIDYNFSDLQMNTALIWACVKGDVEVVNALLQKSDIDINAQDDSGRTALIYAVKFGFKNIVELLLNKRGILTNVKDNYGHDAHWYDSQKKVSMGI